MSVKALNWAFEVSGITAAQKAVLIALADRADMEDCCFPSYEDIMRRSCADRHTIARALALFEDMELITKHKRYGRSTQYKLLIPDTIAKKKPVDEEGFEDWWKSYPRKVNKAGAKKAWQSLSLEDRKEAAAQLDRYEFSEDQKFVPHPKTWLSQRRWEDVSEIKEEFIL